MPVTLPERQSNHASLFVLIIRAPGDKDAFAGDGRFNKVAKLGSMHGAIENGERLADEFEAVEIDGLRHKGVLRRQRIQQEPSGNSVRSSTPAESV